MYLMCCCCTVAEPCGLWLVAGAERRITLSSIRAPRVGRRDEKPEPWAQEARELLRTTIIGELPVCKDLACMGMPPTCGVTRQQLRSKANVLNPSTCGDLRLPASWCLHSLHRQAAPVQGFVIQHDAHAAAVLFPQARMYHLHAGKKVKVSLEYSRQLPAPLPGARPPPAGQDRTMSFATVLTDDGTPVNVRTALVLCTSATGAMHA